MFEDKEKEEQEAKKSVSKKFDPKKAVQKAEKEQPGSDYVIEFVLTPQEAEPFEYLSEWNGKEFVYRVAARLKVKDSDNIKVQLKRVPDKTPTNA